MDAKTVKTCFNRESFILYTVISLYCICMGIKENLLVHVPGTCHQDLFVAVLNLLKEFKIINSDFKKKQYVCRVIENKQRKGK